MSNASGARAHLNTCVLCGRIAAPPQVRTLPSGDRLACYEITVRLADQPTETVPVVWFDPPARMLRAEPGLDVVVVGRVRRRFFQTGLGTGSRTEVVAASILPTTQRARIERALEGVVDALLPGSG